MSQLYKSMPCKHCGKMLQVEVHSKWASCPECKQEQIRQWHKKRYLRNREKIEKELPVMIIKDKLSPEEGGFKPGAQFNRQEFTFMIKSGVITPGTILTIKGKQMKFNGSKVVEC